MTSIAICYDYINDAPLLDALQISDAWAQYHIDAQARGIELRIYVSDCGSAPALRALPSACRSDDRRGTHTADHATFVEVSPGGRELPARAIALNAAADHAMACHAQWLLFLSMDLHVQPDEFARLLALLPTLNTRHWYAPAVRNAETGTMTDHPGALLVPAEAFREVGGYDVMTCGTSGADAELIYELRLAGYTMGSCEFRATWIPPSLVSVGGRGIPPPKILASRYRDVKDVLRKQRRSL